MRAKAIRDMNQLNDADFFKEVSEGLDLIIDHCSHIEADARYLAEYKKACGFNILKAILKEEAAKYLILLDAVRCPRVPPDNFGKQLTRFNDHLAKGIYALVYDLRPTDLGEVRRIVGTECHEYYLDGPNDVDWIFRNEILQRREETIYVDYIESDGDHIWLSPKRFYHPELVMISLYHSPQILEVANALTNVGFNTPKALSVVAERWRSIQMEDALSWSQLREINLNTLKDLEREGLLNKAPDSVCSIIIDRWLFPLYNLDIRTIKVNKSDLEETRDRRFFEMFY